MNPTLPAAAGLLLLLLVPTTLGAGLPSDQHDTDAAAARMAAAYPKILSTHVITGRYQFEPTKHYVVEGAERMLAAGFNQFKFKLHPEFSNLTLLDITPPSLHTMTLLDMVTSPEFPYLEVLDMPFQQFIFWVEHPVSKWLGRHFKRGDGSLSRSIDDLQWSKQVYDLTAFLIQRYEGTGKTFMLGGWKADYQLRQWTGEAHPDAFTPINTARMAIFKRIWQQQYAAVNKARTDFEAHMKGVQVFTYMEVNLMRNATVPITAVDDVLPFLQPPPDLVSVSLSTLQPYLYPLQVQQPQVHQLLDHVAAQLPPRTSSNNIAAGPRVIIGELEFPLLSQEGNADPWTPTEDMQAYYALATAAECISWGTPAVNWWTLYDNTKTTQDNKPFRVVDDPGCCYQDRGFGLVSHTNTETVLYKAIQQFLAGANSWLLDQIKATGDVPCADEFRAWAVTKLIQLANDAVAATPGEAQHLLAPPFIPRGCSV